MSEDGYTEHRLKVARTARWGMRGGGAAPTDIWIVLHGYGQLARSLASSARWPDLASTAFVFPEALQRFYAADENMPHATAPVGASWMTRDARLDDIEDNHAYLDELVAVLRAKAPAARLHVLGFSQGAATAARWAEARSRDGSPLVRLVIWGALLAPEVDIGPSAPLRRTAVSFASGTRDRWVTPARIDAECARLDAAGFPYSLIRFEGGHRLDDDTLRRVVSVP